MNIFGISAFCRNAAACLARDAKIVAAAQEVRFTNRDQDPSHPVKAAA
jgi:predicted NodU family carbamoyl transferase